MIIKNISCVHTEHTMVFLLNYTNSVIYLKLAMYLIHLSTSHLVVHKASVMCLHFSRLTTSFLTSSYDFHPSSLSFSIILHQVVFGLPLFLFPSGAHVRAIASSLFLSFLSMRPINFHLRLFTSLLKGSISAL